MADTNDSDYLAATQGLMQISSDLINYEGTRREAEKERDFSKEMSAYTYQQDLEQWNRQNEYNSPSEQQKRLLAAGLNPALMYGQGNTGNAGTSPKYNKPTGSFPYSGFTAPDMLGMYQDFRIKSAQVDNLKAINKNIIEDNTTKRIKNELLGYDVEKGQSQFDYDMSALDAKKLMLGNQIRTSAAKAGIDENRLKWLVKKNDTMQHEGINIDKDSITNRFLGNLIGEETLNAFDNWKDKFKIIKEGNYGF